MSKATNDALKAFIQGIKEKNAKLPKNRRPVLRRDAVAVHKLESSRWTSEQIVYLITHTACTCGAESTQTSPIPLVRRFHPLHGVHEEAIKIAHGTLDKHLLPVVQEHRHIEITNCHECINGDTLNPYVQKELFGLDLLAYPFARAFESSRPEVSR